MKPKNLLIRGLGLLCLSVCIASAQDGDKPKGPPPGGPPGGGDAASRIAEFMKRADTNSDGKISKDEFAGMSRKETDQRFERADGNADGFIDADEFGTITQRMREAGGGARRPGEGGPPGGSPGAEGFRRPPGGEGGAPRPEGGPRPEGARRPGGEGGSPGGRPSGGMFGDPKESFKRMDADGNGSLSEEEYVSAMTKLREAMSRGGMRPGGEGGPPGGNPGGFRRPGGEGGPPGGGDGGFRRPPVEGGDQPKEAPKPKEGV